MGGGRSDSRNPNNWFTIPFDENINYKALREQCGESVSRHPLEGDSPMVVELNMDDVMKKVAERMAERNVDQIQPESKPESLQQTNELLNVVFVQFKLCQGFIDGNPESGST